MTFLLPITGSFAQPAAENPTVAMIEADNDSSDWTRAARLLLDGNGLPADPAITAATDWLRLAGCRRRASRSGSAGWRADHPPPPIQPGR